MIYKAFSIYDVRSELYARPFFAVSNGEAIRSFMELVKDRQTLPGKYPADFKLILIGSYDDIKGLLEPVPLVTLGFGSDFISLEATPIGVVPPHA